MAPAARRTGAKDSLVWIVILNYNGAQITLNCIDSALEVDHPNFGVIVVDNPPGDDSVALSAAFARAQL